jgi:hypothetical protein
MYTSCIDVLIAEKRGKVHHPKILCLDDVAPHPREIGSPVERRLHGAACPV